VVENEKLRSRRLVALAARYRSHRVNAAFTGVLVYLVLQLALGFWISRRVKSEVDFLLAGRSLGYALSTFTIFATWFGAETCIGSAGRAYQGGLSATVADPFGYAAALLLFGLLFAVPLWQRKLTTLADLFRVRYGSGVERLAVLLMVPSSILWAAAQIRAFGQVLVVSSDFQLDFTITVAAAAVILYTAAGGMLADAWTDLVQGIVLIAGLVVLAVAALSAGDAAALADVPAERFSIFAADATLIATLERWAPPILGSLVAQELIARALSARSPEVARRSSLAAAGIYLAIGLIPPLIGLMAARTLPGLRDSETVLMTVAALHLDTALYVLFAGALVSAILSTVNSALLVSGSLLAHNLVNPLLPGLSERQRLRANRIAVIGSGLVAYLLALGSSGVYELVEEAASFGTSGIFVVMVFAMWTGIGRQASAYAALATAMVVYAAGAHLELVPHPYMASIAAAVVAYLFGVPLARVNRAILR
jgi:Na+/proline symporter